MTFKVRIYLFLLSLICMACICSSAKAQYIPQNEKLVSGQTVMISVPQAGELLIVSHPGSAVSREKEITLHSSNYEWIPARAGIYEISTPGGPVQVVSVQFGYFPTKGLIVLIIAFIVL